MRARADWRAFLGACALATPLYFFVLDGPARAVLYQAFGVASTTALVVGARRRPRGERVPWYLLAAGVLAWSSGDAVWAWAELAGTTLPFPSIADPIYLLAYPLWVTGLLMLARRGGRHDPTVVLDALIVMVSGGLLSWVYLIRPQIAGFEDGTAVATAAAYPLVDILLLGVLVRMVLSPEGRTSSYWLLVAGAVATLASDVAYSVAAVTSSYVEGTVMDLGWLAFYALWGAAALHPSRPQPAPVPARTLPPWVRIVPFVVAAVPLPVLAMVHASRGDHSLTIPLSVVALPFIAIVGARLSLMIGRLDRTSVMLARDRRELERALGELHLAQRERGELLDRTVRATEEERSRIALDLHDGPIQHLTAISLRLGAARSRLEGGDHGRAAQLLEASEGSVTQSIRGLRDLMAGLRPPALDEGGLVAALHDQLASFQQRTGIEVTFESRMAREPDDDREIVLYRIAQEALANVAKHARATRVVVRLETTPDGVARMEIRDDGVGFAAAEPSGFAGGGSLGLASMEQRARMVGGTLEVRSTPGLGTRLVVEIPGRDP